MTTILISAIGGDIAQATASIVRESFPDWKIIGIDQDTRHGGSLYVDVFSSAPSANSPNYLDWLQKFIETHGIDYCLAMSEAELSVLARNDSNQIGRARLLWAGGKMTLIGCDKLETANFLKSIGVPAPWTLAATEDVAPPSFPCIFKLRNSSGSKAVFRCSSIEEVHFYRTRYPAAVLQEFLPEADKEVTCAVYRTNTGTTYVLQLLRRLSGGFTNWAMVIDDPAISAQCSRVAEAVDLKGAINVQLRLTPHGPRIFEINPRLSSTVLMRHMAGYTDVKWMIDEALGHSVFPRMPIPGIILSRTQGAAVLPSSDANAPKFN